MSRCNRRALAATVAAFGAVALAGCGGDETSAAPTPSPSSPSPAPTPVPDDATVQYFRAPDHNLIQEQMGDDCDLWRKEDVGKKVPDRCCDVSAWPGDSNFSSTPPDARDNPFNASDTRIFACYVRERVPAPGTFVRNAYSCEGGQLKLSEGCAPDGTSMGNGYPMDSASAEQNMEVKGDSETCNCDQGYVGVGCFVALSGFSSGTNTADRTANFLKLAGSACNTVAKYV